MQLTSEQEAIIQSTGNLKVNAVAGSGKTTTIIEYARTRPANSRILYLAFNKSVKKEAAKKFAEKGLRNVQVETAHSLAYKHIFRKHQYKLKEHGYQTHEIVDLLQLQGNGEKHTEYVVANHIGKFITYFCNSREEKIQDMDYLSTVADEKARHFVGTFYRYIEGKTRILLSKMDNGDIDITHDFYLKKFQLSQPTLHYDYILFDEGQDASPAILDVFLRQITVKVIVGDTHQQIYSWRYAVNSLEQTHFKTLHLTVSFRFSQDIADLAMEILKLKKHIGKEKEVVIIGKGKKEQPTTKAVLARTNLGLLLKAIEYVTAKKKVEHIYFEGNISSYSYADEGASLYDVLALHNAEHHRIRDKLVKGMNDMDELEDYIEKTEDVQLGMMVEIVKEYGNEIPRIIKAIKEKHTDEKEKAEMVFSTVHRCKGMEYDAVQIVNDFVTEEALKKRKKEKKDDALNDDKLNEEINLLYVAVTRARSEIYIPQTLMPVGFPPSPEIHIMKVMSREDKKKLKANSQQTSPEIHIMKVMSREDKKKLKANSQQTRTYSATAKNNKANESLTSFERMKKGKQAYQPWTSQLDVELTEMVKNSTSIKDMAEHFDRSKGAIMSHIKKLKLTDFYN